MIITDPYALTPVQDSNGLYLKRDDLFAPFGKGDVNGGKCRQCMLLVEDALSKHDYKGCATYCSIHSPQAPISSAICEAKGIPCKVFFGGTSLKNLQNNPCYRLIKHHKGEVDTSTPSGRHNVLKAKALEFCQENDYFLIQYGFNLEEYGNVLLDAVTRQVENIPDRLENLVITCGSGITTSGVLRGLDRYGKEVENIHLVCTAPNRDELIERMAGKHNYIRHDLYHEKGFVYDKGCDESRQGIRFHPQYEAKTYHWLKHSGLPMKDHRTLMWIVGSDPIGW